MSVIDESVAEVAEEQVTANDNQVDFYTAVPSACTTSDPSGFVEPSSDMPRDAMDADQQLGEDVVNDAAMENDEGRPAAGEGSNNSSRSQGSVFIITDVVPLCSNNNISSIIVYGAVVITIGIARIHLVHFVNVDWVQISNRPSNQVCYIHL